MSEAADFNILVVDDESIMRELLTDYLEMSDFKVDSAENGVVALAKIKEAKEASDEYSLVITDINMPEMGGIDLQANIKKKYPDLPVIFMTGYGIEKVRKELAGKAEGFLGKPFELEELFGLISKILNVEIF